MELGDKSSPAKPRPRAPPKRGQVKISIFRLIAKGVRGLSSVVASKLKRAS